MKKYLKILFMVLLVFVAVSSMNPNYALAINDDEMELYPADGGSIGEPMEQSADANGGADGDPDSMGDGFGFMGNSFGGPISSILDRLELTLQEYLCLLMEQMIFAQ